MEICKPDINHWSYFSDDECGSLKENGLLQEVWFSIGGNVSLWGAGFEASYTQGTTQYDCRLTSYCLLVKM